MDLTWLDEPLRGAGPFQEEGDGTVGGPVEEPHGKDLVIASRC